MGAARPSRTAPLLLSSLGNSTPAKIGSVEGQETPLAVLPTGITVSGLHLSGLQWSSEGGVLGPAASVGRDAGPVGASSVLPPLRLELRGPHAPPPAPSALPFPLVETAMPVLLPVATGVNATVIQQANARVQLSQV